MKIILLALIIFCLSCNNQKISTLEKQVDSLKTELKNTYKPGLGEFMSAIQMHHAKLWFAGKNENWALANFELEELKEISEDAQKFCSDRPEIATLKKFLPPALENVEQAIGKMDEHNFENSFSVLTAACNDCHRSNSFGMNTVIIPTALPVSNQDFHPMKIVDSITPKK